MNELEIMARTIWGEARGESRRGRIAVANVIMNRVNEVEWDGETVVGVCLLHRQFSCWNKGNKNLAKLVAVDLSNAVFRECLEISAEAIAGSLKDKTKGANHYFSSEIHPPKWARNRKPTVKIGKHWFYRL